MREAVHFALGCRLGKSVSAPEALDFGGSFNLKDELSVVSIKSEDFEALRRAVVQMSTAPQILNRVAGYPVFVCRTTACSK